MTNEQKQIEEMAKVLALASCQGYECENCFFDDIAVAKPSCVCVKALYEAGYRKIPEGAVVLTKEEYKRYERIDKIIKLAKREKANGYEVKNGKLYYFTNMLEGFEYEFKDLQEICDTANHYNEEFFGLQQRLDFWKYKAETTAKETAEKFAERLKERAYYVVCDTRCVSVDNIDEICKEITEGK